MLTPQKKRALAVAILRKGKALTPDRFPQPSGETAQAWADALGRTFDSLPFPDLWEQAVVYWSSDMVSERMATPRDLRRAALIIRDQWEGHPVQRKVLAQARERRELERDQALRDGTFLALKGYESPRDGQARLGVAPREGAGVSSAFADGIPWPAPQSGAAG